MLSVSCYSVNCAFCSELLNISKLWIVSKVGLCSKTRPRFKFVICEKMEKLELFRKWYGFLIKLNDRLQFKYLEKK